MSWIHATSISSRTYVCGYCGYSVASAVGYSHKFNPGCRIYICPHCESPSFFLGDSQIPGVASGNEVEYLPAEIESLYLEARNAVSVRAYTASVLACRKLLMNIAVAQGAKEGASFLSYVNHLADNGFVPPNGKGWVDHIRSKGNEANHEIKLMGQQDAEELVSFSEMLLKFIYEFPNRVPPKANVK